MKRHHPLHCVIGRQLKEQCYYNPVVRFVLAVFLIGGVVGFIWLVFVLFTLLAYTIALLPRINEMRRWTG